MAEWVNVFEKAVPDMKAERAKCRAQQPGLAPFRKEQSNPKATGTCVGGH